MRPTKTLGLTPASNAAALLEREGELARLQELVAAAAAGHGAAAAIMGPAGIGKTSLLAAARELAADAGLRVLSARGGELEQDFAYGLVRQLLERPVHELDAEERGAVLEGAAGLAAPVLGLGATKRDGGESAFAVVHGLYWVCANLVQRAPLLLIADDLHWADGASLRFLAYLQRRLEDLPLLVVSAARRPLDASRAELLDVVTGDPAVAQLVPAPLSVEALQALLGPGAEPAFVAACHAATAGNPFLCATLISALGATGIAPVASEVARVTELATHSVAREVVRRMARASDHAAWLVRSVAILGTRSESRHAAALAGLDQTQAAAAADELAAQGLLWGGAQLDFVHPLLRAAVADQIPAAERSLLHRKAARLLSNEGVASERIAMHLLAVVPAADPQVVVALRDAARAVGAHGDPAAAVRYLRRALQEPPDADDRVAVLHELGVAELQVGEPEAAALHLRQAMKLAQDHAKRGAVGRDLSLALRSLRRYRESVAVIDGVICDMTHSDPDRALAMTAELHQTAMMDPATYRAINDRFADLDREFEAGSPGQRAYLAALATEACLRTARAQRIRDWARLAFDRGLIEGDDPQSGLWANVAFPLIFAEGFELAATMSARAADRARRLGSPTAIARAHLVSAMLALRTGSVREAAADARITIDVGREATVHIWPMAVGVALEALVELGDFDAAEEMLRDTGTDGEMPEQFLYTWALLGRGTLRLGQSRLREAIADLEEVRRRGRQGWWPWNPAMFPYRGVLASAVLRTGDPGRALELAEEELELARRWDTPRAIGLALRARGLASGSLDDLREAASTLATSGAKLEHARALVELGAAIARTGTRIEAREPLHAGMELAHRCGATALAARAWAELIAAGARPRRIMRTGVHALTSSELRVARMAADGMTNREIAQALFVTLRTVQVHLTHTYQKLDISSREELKDAFAT